MHANQFTYDTQGNTAIQSHALTTNRDLSPNSLRLKNLNSVSTSGACTSTMSPVV